LELQKIIEECVEGKREAQRVLYEKFAPRMFAVCLRYAKNRTDAEDFLHDGFIKIFENIDQFKHKGSFEGWIRRIMVNNILEYFRKNSKYHLEDETHLPPMPTEENEEQSEFEDIKYSEILKWIDQLPERYKMVFNLYVIENYSHNEIAKEMGISVGTSKSNLSRARQWLKDYISKEVKSIAI